MVCYIVDRVNGKLIQGKSDEAIDGSSFGTEEMMGQEAKTFEKEIRETVQAKYLLYLPEDYDASEEEWPLMLFLHGRGERGDDLKKVANNGPPRLVEEENHSFPFVIVSPQCPTDDWWPTNWQVAVLDSLLTEIVTTHRIDTDRIYVTGLSMGGFGTWRLASEYPNRFAAIAPICGGGNPDYADRIVHLPIWVFHGAKDPTVPIEKSEEMVEALERAGGEPKFTVYPEAKHDSWTETYNNSELYEWFLKHKRGG